MPLNKEHEFLNFNATSLVREIIQFDTYIQIDLDSAVFININDIPR